MNVVMLWLRVAAWLVVWVVVRDWVAAREVLGLGAALDGWEVVVAVVLRLVKGRRGEQAEIQSERSQRIVR